MIIRISIIGLFNLVHDEALGEDPDAVIYNLIARNPLAVDYTVISWTPTCLTLKASADLVPEVERGPYSFDIESGSGVRKMTDKELAYENEPFPMLAGDWL